MPVALQARAASMEDVLAVLREQNGRKLDVVCPTSQMRFDGGLLIIGGSEVAIDESGVTPIGGAYRCMEIFDTDVSAKFRVPRDYLRRMRADAPDLVDANLNGWLHGWPTTLAEGEQPVRPPDNRRFLLRLFRGDDGGPGVARALLSDKFKITMDNLDMLTAVLGAFQARDIRPDIPLADLSETRLRVRFTIPGMFTDAPTLLANYRSPFDGTRLRVGNLANVRRDAHGMIADEDRPIVGFGMDLTNSETGDGKYALTPVVEVLACFNGLVVTKQAFSKVHLGARMADGIVDVSAETVRKAAELVRSETVDCIDTWMKPDYLRELVQGLEEQAGAPVKDATQTISVVAVKLGFTEEEQRSILDHFVAGGQLTAGGVMQAVSSVAQTIESPDRAYEVELKAIPAMEAAAEMAR